VLSWQAGGQAIVKRRGGLTTSYNREVTIEIKKALAKMRGPVF